MGGKVALRPYPVNVHIFSVTCAVPVFLSTRKVSFRQNLEPTEGSFAVKHKSFNVEQIVAVLKQAEAGVPLAGLIRRVGISEQTFYRWKKQYVGLEVDQVRQLKQLQEENTRLKQLVADLTLDKAMLQGVLSKKNLEPSRRRQVVEYLHGRFRVSEQLASRVARLNRGTFRYRAHKDPRTALRMRIREIAQTRVRYGYSVPVSDDVPYIVQLVYDIAYGDARLGQKTWNGTRLVDRGPRNQDPLDPLGTR